MIIDALERASLRLEQLQFNVHESTNANDAKEDKHISTNFELDNRKELSHQISTEPANNTRGYTGRFIFTELNIYLKQKIIFEFLTEFIYAN